MSTKINFNRENNSQIMSNLKKNSELNVCQNIISNFQVL